MKAVIKALLIFMLLMACTGMCDASVVIDSVKANASTCVNNGSFTVYAQTTSPPLLYSIIDGPTTAPAQSNNTFNSLAPGVYQLLVTNFNNDSAMQFVPVPGNYNYPEFTTTVVNTSCTYSTDGRIVGFVTPNTGCAPFVWQLTNNQTGSSITQSSRDFTGLAAGSYTLQLTDSCLNTTIKTVLVEHASTGMQMPYQPRYTVRGCYYTEMQFDIRQTDGSALLMPLSIRISTRYGTYTRAANVVGGAYIAEVVPQVSYGDTINTIVINACGDSLVYTHYIHPFEFIPYVNTQYNSCNQQSTTVSATIYNHTVVGMPAEYIVRDSVSGNQVEAGTVRDFSTIAFGQYPTNRTYVYTITDSCGATYTGRFYWPSTVIPPPTVSYYTGVSHCLDSTASIHIGHMNFPYPPTLRLTSGPPAIGSTKPGYSYSDVSIYNVPIASNGGYFAVHNLGAGVYHFEVYDNCGHVLRDSFIITPAMLGDDNYSLEYVRGCPGENSLICNFFTLADTSELSMTMGNYTITNVQTGQVANSFGYFYYNSKNIPFRTDTVRYLDAGTYAISIQYNSGFGGSNEGYHPNQVYDCWTIQDTIEIPPYRRPEIVNAIKITCHGNSFIELRADSASGVPPYTYEIIGGPQTAPAQINPEFSLSLVGTYLARITDACGTANTTNFTIDTAAFPPINKFGSSCTGGTTLLTYQSSPHIIYMWRKPNGSVYTGDTLLLNPTTTADTGVYEVTKIVTINGCVDSFTAYYSLQQNTMHYVYDTICHGSSVSVGNHTYSSSGTYRDTLATTGGCDSIVVLNLHIAYRRDSTLHTLCAGEFITISGISYSNNASFDDTITGGGCDSIHTVVISVKDYLRGGRLETICSGGQYNWNGRTYTTTGIYRDTLATTGCDSVAVLYLSVLPIPHETMSATICEGETYLWGGNYYYEAGVYRDSVPSEPCYKTRELTLHVAAKPQGSTETQKYSVEFNDSVTLNACITDSAYHWNYGACAGCSTITVKPKDEYNYYQCTITNGDGCSVVCNYEVYVEGIYGNVFVPNVFTPNGDGANDVFRIYGENIRFHSMQVFNRWGEKIYDNENENNGWDGTYKGALQPPGVYVYMVKYSPLYTAESRNIKGSVTLLK